MKVSGQLQAKPLYPTAKALRCPLNERLARPRSRPRNFGGEKNLFSSAEKRTKIPPYSTP